MGWPAAHRSRGHTSRADRPAAGFQKPAAPANDNFRPPANDNWKPFHKPPPSPIAPFGKRLPPGAAAALRRSSPLLKLATRGVPVIGTALLLYDLYQLSREVFAGGPYNLEGWTLEEFCTSGRSWTNQSGPCGVVAGAGSGTGPDGLPVPFNLSLINFRKPRYTQNVFGRWNFEQAEKWRRTSGLVQSGRRTPWIIPRTTPRHWPEPAWVPAFDPFLVPMGRPIPTPAPVPRDAVPAVAASSGPNDGNWSESGNETGKVRRPRPKPYHRHRPPRKDEKERKSKVRKGLSLVLRGAYAATEAQDFVEALTDGVWTPFGQLPPAFPPHLLKQLGKDASMYEKSKFIYDNFEHLDLDQAMVNLAANHVIDLVVGMPQGQLTNWANQHGIVHGNAFSGPLSVY